jgi:hypothetical protein
VEMRRVRPVREPSPIKSPALWIATTASFIVRTRPPQSDRVIVAVEDIGVGIKPENCRPAFQRILHHQARGVFSLQG